MSCATKSTKLTPLQRRVLESKELKGTYDDAFKATIAVLQDMGYTIKTSDYTGGLIYAESSRDEKRGGKPPLWAYMHPVFYVAGKMQKVSYWMLQKHIMSS